MLLRRHIEKEDTVVYPFAKKHLIQKKSLLKMIKVKSKLLSII